MSTAGRHIWVYVTVLAATSIAPLIVRAADETSSQQPALQEVVVTAQKREQSIQEVPVPMTVIDAEALSATGQVGLQDYYATVPGLNIALNSYGSPQLVIRGLTTGPFTNPTVGIVVDDVPFTSSANGQASVFTPDFDPSDLARIEVLRGPQGTLYGASSIGGLIKFVTIDPSPEGFSGRLESDLSSVKNSAELGYGLRAAANVPLSDTWAVRMSGFARQDPGYIDDPGLNATGVNRAEAYGGHLSGLWRPTEDVNLKLSAFLEHATSKGLSIVDAGLGDLQQSVVRDSGASDRTFQAYSATLNAKVGGAELTAVSGYNISRTLQGFDFTSAVGAYATLPTFGTLGTVVEVPSDLRKFTQEIRLSSSFDHKIDWVVGAFYTHEDNNGSNDLWQATVPETGKVLGVGLYYDTFYKFSEYAGFADVTFHFTDRFDVQLGGRESYNRQYNALIATGPFVPLFFVVPSPFVQGPEYAKDNSFTYLVTPRLKLSPDIMLYARFASGYEPGGPDLGTAGIPGLPRQFNAETADNYEIGIKSDILNHRLSIDASLYYIDWKSLQLLLTDPATGVDYEANGGGAKSEGVELSVESKVSSNLNAAFWVTYDDAVMTSVPSNEVGFYAVPGDRLPYGSRFSGNVSLDARFALVANWTGFIGGTVSYIGDRLGGFTGAATSPRAVLPAYGQTNLRSGISSDRWIITVFANNLFDKRGLIGEGSSLPTPAEYQITQPRTFGVSFVTKF